MEGRAGFSGICIKIVNRIKRDVCTLSLAFDSAEKVERRNDELDSVSIAFAA